MKFVRGKRQHRQEKLYGLVIVTEERAGVRTLGFVIGYRVWGWQWPLKRKK